MSFSARRRLRATVLILGVAAAIAGPASAPAMAAEVNDAQLPTHGLRYVALGDSFSSGLGLANRVADSPAFCHRSADNFPHIVARALDLQLTDVTCGGATTANIISTPLKYGKQQVPVQTRALTRQTDIVTITIGGNDLGFVDVTRSCLAIGASGPLLLSKAHNCESRYVSNGVDKLEEKLKTTVAHGSPAHPSGLAKTFAEIHRRAPHAKVFVVGYPSIMPDAAHTPAGGCFDLKLSGSSLQNAYAENVFPFTDVDTAYMHTLEQSLNSTVKAAARAAGFVFVPTSAASAAHSACAPDGERFVNGVSVTRSDGGDPVLDIGSLHPNSTGATFLAASLTPVISREFPAPSRQTLPGATGPSWWPMGLILGALGALGALGVAAVVVTLVVRRRSKKGRP